MSERRFALRNFVNLEGDKDDTDGVMVDTHSATMVSCNETAWVLLHALRSKAGVADLVAALQARFDVPEADARKDVMGFIHRLSAMGLVDEKG